MIAAIVFVALGLSNCAHIALAGDEVPSTAALADDSDNNATVGVTSTTLSPSTAAPSVAPGAAPASPHTGAYTGALLHDTGPSIQVTKIRANWVPTKGEILQVCGIKIPDSEDNATNCQQIKLSYVEKSKDDMKVTEQKSSDGEEIFRIKYWPPFPHRVPAGSPVNKAGTDAIAVNPAWDTSNCTTMDVTLTDKIFAPPNKTQNCRDMVTQPETLFEFFKLPKFAGPNALAMSILGVFAGLASAVAVVAVKRTMRSYQELPAQALLDGDYSDA